MKSAQLFIISLLLSISRGQSPFSTAPLSLKVRLRIDQDLPPDIHRLFNVSIRFPQFHKVNSALLVYLVNRTDISHNLLDTFVFRPGSQTQLTKPFQGRFLIVPYCVSESIDRVIELHLRFNSSAQNTTLLVFYSPEYRPRINKPTATLVYESQVSCKVSAKPRINMTMGTTDSNELAFVRDQSVWINCSSVAEHEPRWRSVRMEGLDQFDILKQIVENQTLKSSVYTSASIRNHGKTIVCRSMNHHVTRMMLIYHHPEAVYTVPTIGSWSTIPSNVSITCCAKGGYPPPVVTWEMVIGPHNASLYHRLNHEKTILIMHDSAPPGSKWIFDCSAKNSIPFSSFQGPVMRIYSNVAELTIERRKVVVIVVPIVVAFIIIVICTLNTYCFKSVKQKKIKSLLETMPQNNLIASKIPRYSDRKLFNYNKNIISRKSSSVYSIETGIDFQTLSVLDEGLLLFTRRGSCKSLPPELLRINGSIMTNDVI